jgi:type IV pilus assembly protein PilO
MAENPLTKLPLAGQLGVSAGLAAVIAVAFWYFYWSDAVKQEAAKTANLETLQADIRKLEITANKLEEFKREVATREAKLETLKRILPAEKETPDLMRKVNYLALQSSLIIKRFNPAPTVTKEFYQEWPINVDVEGTYHNLAMFFDRVGRLTRLVNVGNVKVRANSRQTATNTITSNCVATTYVYVETPPPAAGPARPGAAK